MTYFLLRVHGGVYVLNDVNNKRATRQIGPIIMLALPC